MTTVSKPILSKRFYTRDLPVFITSAIIATLTINYFISWEPLQSVSTELLTWSNIISLLVWTFAVAMLVLKHVRRLSKSIPTNRRQYLESAVMIGSLTFFLLLGLTDPLQEKGANFSRIYIKLIGNISMGTGAVGITHYSYNMWKRLTQSSFTPEFLAMMATVIFSRLRTMSIVNAVWPYSMVIGDWIELVLFTAGFRAVTIITAIGTLIVAVRALTGKERGIMEAEMT